MNVFWNLFFYIFKGLFIVYINFSKKSIRRLNPESKMLLEQTNRRSLESKPFDSLKTYAAVISKIIVVTENFNLDLKFSKN